MEKSLDLFRAQIGSEKSVFLGGQKQQKVFFFFFWEQRNNGIFFCNPWKQWRVKSTIKSSRDDVGIKELIGTIDAKSIKSINRSFCKSSH